MWLSYQLIALILFVVVNTAELHFPDVLTATYTTTAHQIVKESQYPSREKVYTLYYDKLRRAGRIEYTNENGVHITNIRNYAEHYEVRIESVNGEDLCEYSYLGESFPEPEFPESIQFVNKRRDGHQMYSMYSYQQHRQYIDIRMDATTGYPVRTDEFYIAGAKDAKPVFSTFYTSISPVITDSSVFDVKQYVESGKCTRNNKGWPYQHVFGPFVRV